MQGSCISDGCDVGVRHGKCEPRPLQQRTQITDVGEGGDARTGPTLDLDLGFDEGLPKLGQGRAAKQGAEEQAVRLQTSPDLDQRTRQIVDEMQAQARHDEIERGFGEGQSLPRSMTMRGSGQ